MPLIRIRSLLYYVIIAFAITSMKVVAQSNPIPERKIPILDVHSTKSKDTSGSRLVPVIFYYTVMQSYPGYKFGAMIGEIIHVDVKNHRRRQPIPHNYYEWRGTVCDRRQQGITNLDSLTKETCTQYFMIHNADSIKLFFVSFTENGPDTSAGAYGFPDTVGFFVDVVDSASGKIVQTLDSCIMLPFDKTTGIARSSYYRNMYLAMMDINRFPLKSDFVIHLPEDSLKVKIQIRIHFGATVPTHTANVMQEVTLENSLQSVMIQDSQKERDNEVSEREKRLIILYSRYTDSIDVKLSKLISVQIPEPVADEALSFTITSSQGREYTLRAVNEQGETVHDFGKSYAFPGMDQTFKWETTNQPKGVYAVTISTGGKLCYLVPFIVRHDGSKLVPRAPKSDN